MSPILMPCLISQPNRLAARVLLVSALIATSSLVSVPAAMAASTNTVAIPGPDDVVKTANRLPTSSSDQLAYTIAVDGEVIDASGEVKPSGFGVSSAASVSDRNRKTDVDLSAVDIQVKYDGLDQRTLLNVSTMPVQRSYRAGDTITFLSSSNYPAFISRAEIRIEALDGSNGAQPVAIIPAVLNGTSSWRMPETGPDAFAYVLRVYDDKGRFDETAPLTLARTTKAGPAPDGAIAPGMAEDRTAIRNIEVFGGAVTVYGRNVPAGYQVQAFNEIVPLDHDRDFVIQRILPTGDHQINVAIKGASKSGGLNFSRAINIPTSEWFYVALGDLTLGRRVGDEGIETVRSGEYDDFYTKGRMAFYLKGKIKGQTILTAAADTGEDSLNALFSNLDDSDPKQLLRRIDPDDYYPVYGDNSTILEDAPTNGKFYVRLERGDSHVLWGNYKVEIKGTKFLASNRGLYGANGLYQSPDITPEGERKSQIVGYAARPETLPQHDEFLATGGSAYYLKHQDITTGSETLTVEVRDAVSGEVSSSSTLVEGEDYSIDYLQGILILSSPLSTSTTSTSAVRTSALGGNDVYLIADYEYTPELDQTDAYSFGGRVQHWFGNAVRVGVTAMDEKSSGADQRLYGIDLKLRPSKGSYVEAEVAHSEGVGYGTSRSTDGGITMTDYDGADADSAYASRVAGKLDLADLPGGKLNGSVSGYYEKKNAGFSALSTQTTVGQSNWGASIDFNPTGSIGLKLGYDDLEKGNGYTNRQANVETSYRFDDSKKASFGLTYSNLASPTALEAGKTGYNGTRIDAGARADYALSDDTKTYGFGQVTLQTTGDLSRNDRAGVGATQTITDKVSLSGEASYGTSGLGLLAAVNYDPTAEDHHYIGYRLDPDRASSGETAYDLTGHDTGTIVAGVKRRLTEKATAYAEDSYDMFGRRVSLAQTYGVEYTPDNKWKISGNYTSSNVRDDTIDTSTGLERSDYDRNVVGLTASLSDTNTGTYAHVRGQARFEDSEDNTRDVNTYLMSAGISKKSTADWRAIADLDAVVSSGTNSAEWNGHYVEGSIGYAYRPIKNDRVNALLKYTYLQDEPASSQVSAVTGTVSDIQQRSHILSADVNYDVVPWLTIGGKYGLRLGEIKEDDSAGWEQSIAQLYIARADLHVISKWDALIEARILNSPSAETTDYGALLGLYRHVGENFKVGVGYNFGRFSDDLRDVTLDDQGAFVNAVAKY